MIFPRLRSQPATGEDDSALVESPLIKSATRLHEMSLKEAYTLAHSAQCRLQMAASRPDRNLRFVVGHLMHYESLRLRIVEIEHDVSKSHRASAVAFKGTGHVDYRLQHKPSTGDLRKKSPPPPAYDDEDTDEDDDYDEDDLPDEDEEAGLSLERFPSGTARPVQPPPDLVPDDPAEEDEEFDEPISPEEPDQETLERCIKGDGSELMATMYEGVRKCACHGKTNAPAFDRMWELPPDQNTKQGVTRAIAHMTADMAPQMSCTEPVAV